MTEERKPQTDGKSSGRKVGRPVEPVPKDVADRIIDWISAGKTLRDFCRLDGSPCFKTVYTWTEKDAEFATRLARAREIGHDAIAEETLEIIDTRPKLAVSDNGSRVDSGHVAWLKNRAEQRMKLLAVWSPKKYGSRTTVAGDPDSPLIEPLDDAQRAAKVQAIMAAAAARKASDGV